MYEKYKYRTFPYIFSPINQDLKMARRTRRRFRRKAGRWSPNIQQIRLSGTAEANSNFGDSITIAQNPGQSNTTVSQKYTVKNVEISGLFEIDTTSTASGSLIEQLTYYIMYVPEGYPININLPTNHPEWILAYKYVGQSYNNSSTLYDQPPKISTRLARKLNTGDSIIFLYTGTNISENNIGVKFTGLTRWWTKAN